MTKQIHVSNLAFDISEEALGNFFRRHNAPPVKVVIIKRNGRSAGFGFVTFATESEANRVIQATNGASLANRVLRVSKVRPKDSSRKGVHGNLHGGKGSSANGPASSTRNGQPSSSSGQKSATTPVIQFNASNGNGESSQNESQSVREIISERKGQILSQKQSSQGQKQGGQGQKQGGQGQKQSSKGQKHGSQGQKQANNGGKKRKGKGGKKPAVPFTVPFETIFHSLIRKCCRGKLPTEVIEIIFQYFRQGTVKRWMKRVQIPYQPEPSIMDDYLQVNGWGKDQFDKLQVSISTRMDKLWKKGIDHDLTSRFGMFRAFHSWCMYAEELEFRISEVQIRGRVLNIYFNCPLRRDEKWALFFDKLSGPRGQIFLRLFYLLRACGDMSISSVKLHIIRSTWFSEKTVGHVSLDRAVFDRIYNRGSLRQQFDLWHKYDPSNEEHWSEPFSPMSEESKKLSAELVCYSHARGKEFKMHTYPPAPETNGEEFIKIDPDDEDPDEPSDDDDDDEDDFEYGDDFYDDDEFDEYDEDGDYFYDPFRELNELEAIGFHMHYHYDDDEDDDEF